MRERKFRAWDGYKNEMLTNPNDIPIYYEEDNGFHSGKENEFGDWVNLILIEWTGKKDIKGVEIYCGDIVADEDDNTAEIRWSNLQAQFYADFEDYEDLVGVEKWATIIGNVFQDSGLLK